MQRRHWRDVKVIVLPILNLGARREWSTLRPGCFTTDEDTWYPLTVYGAGQAGVCSEPQPTRAAKTSLE